MKTKNNAVDYTQKLLEVKELRQYFKVGSGKNKIIVKAIDNVSFDIYRREVFGLVGESGSGKTTTGRTIEGLYTPTGGQITYKGNVIGSGSESIIYDIKRIKKQRKLDVLLQNPYQKALYDAKQSKKAQLSEIELAKRNATMACDKQLALANKDNYDHQQAVLDLRREQKLELADIEKAKYSETRSLSDSNFKIIEEELNKYVKYSNKRFAKKYQYLRDSKLHEDLWNQQFNSFFKQYVEEIQFAYQLLDRKISGSDQLQYFTGKSSVFERGIKALNKKLKSDKISDDNRTLCSEVIENLTNRKQQLNQNDQSFEHRSVEQNYKHKIEEINNKYGAQMEAVNQKYEQLISQLPQPETAQIDIKTAEIKAKYELLIAEYDQKSAVVVAQYKEAVAKIKEDFKGKKKEYNQEEVQRINEEANAILTKKYTELQKAREANNLRESAQSKEKRLAKLQVLKTKYQDDLAKAATVEEKNAIAKKYHEDVKTINSEIPSYANVLASMQMIFQDPISSLNPRMTVREIIGEGLKIKGVKSAAERETKIAEVLKLVGLQPSHADRYPHEFSGGQRQRIGIARALVIDPEFIIADEPISALDVSIQAQVINLLNDLKNQFGLTILFIAHDLSVVKYFSDRIAVMFKGKIVELATAEELFANPLHPYTKSLLSAIPEPNPETEKSRQRIIYNPGLHDYSVDKPQFSEITPGHFIYANQKELAEYSKELKGGNGK